MTTSREKLGTGTRWEKEVGYSRAVKFNNWVEVSRLIALGMLVEIEATAWVSP